MPPEDDEKRAPPDIVIMAALPAAKDAIKEDFLPKISSLSGAVVSTGCTDRHYVSEARM
jgi:hypothetical protein